MESLEDYCGEIIVIMKPYLQDNSYFILQCLEKLLED